MGLSSNQARFLSLTARQIDMEQRIQQICQRRLRLSSELENVATHYNNAISNRKMFTPSLSGLNSLSVDTLQQLGFKVINTNTQKIVGTRPPSVSPPNQIAITSQEQFLNIVNQMNTTGVGLDKNYILECDIDLSSYDTGGKALIQGNFTGNFDGNCYQVKNLNIMNTDPSTNPTSTYYACSATSTGLGMFEHIVGGTVANLELSNINISLNGNVCRAGALAGSIYGGAQISNINVSDATISGSTDSKGLGGLTGIVEGAATTISECSVDADVSGAWSLGGLAGQMSSGTIQRSETYGTVVVDQATMRTPDGFMGDRMAGGIVGTLQGGGIVDSCHSDADLTSNYSYTGGIAGIYGGTGLISNCYSTGNISGNGSTGGIAGDIRDSGSVINSYAQTTITSGASTKGGVFGARASVTPGDVSNSFYDNSLYSGDFGPMGDAVYWTNSGSLSSTEIANHTGNFNTITSSWDKTNVWDFSNGTPTLRNIGYDAFGTDVEENLRSGRYTLIKEADEYTQEPLTIDDEQYEKIDWRTMPEIYDELYKADDVDAENKYDKTIEEINSQDKKLQLEQTSIEVEYKAITSEREYVKKILDTNAQNSFKYFS